MAAARAEAASLTWRLGLWTEVWRRARPRSLARQLARLSAKRDLLAWVLFEQPGIGVLAVDRSGAILRANAALRGLTGAEAGLSPGRPAASLFAEAERDHAATELAACLRGEPGRPDFASVLRGGVSVGVSAVALREPDGSVGGALLRLADLSAQRGLESQLAQAQKMQAMGQLAGGIAHDFNNLLTAVLGAAETAAARTELPVEVLDDLAQIRASAGRGAALVRQLLAFGRQQTLQPQVLALNDLAGNIAGLLRRLLGRQIRLELELEEPGGQVRADPTQLDQVLVNLAVNARDAMPDGGVLTLRTRLVTLHRTQAQTWTQTAEAIPPGRYVTLEVADTGRGIAPDILPRIFDPFFTTRREQGGTGLGLSTVHGIVRQSGGFVDVTSTPGEGTTMRLYLPRADDRAMAIPPPPPEAPQASRRGAPTPCGTLLLVDDEEPVRDLARRALSREGWLVAAVEGGEQALAALTPELGDLAAVVTDLAMHGMDGVQVMRAVRARTRRPDLPVLIVSGYAEASLRQQLAGETSVAFLAKPYELRELVDAVAAIAPTSHTPADVFVAKMQVSNIR